MGSGLLGDLGLLYDDLSLALSRLTLTISSYNCLLAAMGTMFEAWAANPRRHTKLSTTIIIILSNALSLLDIRFLSTQGGMQGEGVLRWQRVSRRNGNAP